MTKKIVETIKKPKGRPATGSKSPNRILKLMIKNKKYSLMQLVEKNQTTRQDVNCLLNKGVKEKVIKREGLRKHYLYTKV